LLDEATQIVVMVFKFIFCSSRAFIINAKVSLTFQGQLLLIIILISGGANPVRRLLLFGLLFAVQTG
jgi:hypothetical protein